MQLIKDFYTEKDLYNHLEEMTYLIFSRNRQFREDIEWGQIPRRDMWVHRELTKIESELKSIISDSINIMEPKIKFRIDELFDKATELITNMKDTTKR